MTSNLEPNIHCLAVKDSVFDDCQSIVKACFGDAKFNERMSLGAVNSINWSRILAQIVYYVYAVASKVDANTSGLSFVVPTGNFGNILAGYYAKQMGVPIKSLVIASNSNDILPKFFESGEYRVSGHVVPTMSPSMDIAVSSNFERYLYDLWGRDSKILASKFNQLKTDKIFTVSPDQLLKAQHEFKSYAIDEHETLDTIAQVYRDHKYLLCPHSAVGYAAALHHMQSPEYVGETVVTLATAHIGKFTENILESPGAKDFDESIRSAIQKSIPEGLSKLSGAKTQRELILTSLWMISRPI
jgi:threonine synthase